MDAGSVPGVIRVNTADAAGLEGLVLGGLIIGGALYLRHRHSAAPTAPPPVVPTVVENRRPPSDAKDPNGAKAPGQPGEAEGFEDSKEGERWVSNPNGRGNGWLDSKGNTRPEEDWENGFMKNVQVIDGALNTAYRIYQFTDEQFALIFPGRGQDIEFHEDLQERLTPNQLDQAFEGVWERPIGKTDVQGIHGTLFYELGHKKKYYPNKTEADVADLP